MVTARGSKLGCGASHPTGVRGLKYGGLDWIDYGVIVAPHWGAWIEIQTGQKCVNVYLSHPTGVRGLKWVDIRRGALYGKSHPTGVRGLK